MEIKQYVVDAFTDKVFKGNPAAVCILPEWIPDMLMQNIAKENNLSETAFTVKRENIYELALVLHQAVKLTYAVMPLWVRHMYYFVLLKKTVVAFLFKQKAVSSL